VLRGHIARGVRVPAGKAEVCEAAPWECWLGCSVSTAALRPAHDEAEVSAAEAPVSITLEE